MAAERAVLIGSGVFKVDRARALEKLMRFALPDPAHAALLLVRCAAASEAAAVSVRRAPDGALTVSFDGAPLSPGELASPYDSLFHKASPKTRRGRELATALLTLLRLKPARILVRSGLGDARAQLRVTLAEQELAEPMPDGGVDTVVKFVPAPGTSRKLWGSAFAETLRASCAMAPMPVFLDDERLPSALPEEWGDERAPISGEGLRGWVAIPPRLESHSRLQFYRLGVLVGQTALQLGTPPVVGRLDDPAFRLNASQTAVVRDDRHKRALAAVEAAARRLVVEAAERQTARVAQLTRLLDDEPLRQTWSRALAEWLDAPAAGLLGAFGRLFTEAAFVDRELGRAVRADARRTAWLREAAARAARGPADDPLRAALEAPVHLSPDLELRTHAELLQTAGALGYVPVSSTPRAEDASAFPVILLTSDTERAALTRLFPGVGVEDAAGALDRARRLAELGDEAAAVLERLGIERVLCRHPLAPPWRGEVGLALHRPDAARLHTIVGGAADQSVALPGELRFTAVIDTGVGMTPERTASAARAVLEAAAPLYAAAAGEFSPEDASPEGEALRAHLLDALAWEVRRGSPDKVPAHLRSLPLFPCEAGLLDYQGLRTRFSWGETLFFLRRRSRLPAPALTFRHESFTLEFLKRLLPEAETAAVAGRPELRLAWLKRPAVPLSPKNDAETLARLEDILRRRGALPEAPADPDRAVVLDGVRRFFTPWIGAPRSTPRWHRVREHLAVLPLFRRPKGVGWSPLQLDARLASGRTLLYGDEGGPAGDALLNAGELALLDALWPSSRRTAAPAPAASPRKSRGASPRRAGDAPPAANPLFEAPMLVVRDIELGGLRATVGLPVEPLPGVTATLVGPREPVDLPFPVAGLAAAGRLRIDVSNWSGATTKGGALVPDLYWKAVALYARFLETLLDDWPSLAEGPSADGLRAYFLLFAAPRQDDAGTWGPFRVRLDAVKLFPTLDGGSASLGELRAQAKADGRVRYAKAAAPPPSPSAASVPIVRLPRLAAAALNAPFVPFDDPPAAAPAPSGEPLQDAMESLLSALRGRRGLDPAILPEPGALRLVKGNGRKLLVRAGPEWNLDLVHPKARLVLEAFAAAPAAPFLLSLLASEANRDSERATDAHDGLLQVLLAEVLDSGRAA